MSGWGKGPGPGPGPGGPEHGRDPEHMPGPRGCGPGGFFAGRGGPWQRFKHRLFGDLLDERLLHEIGLSDEQVEQLADLRMSRHSKMAQYSAAVNELMRLIAKELAQETIDKDKVSSLRAELKAQKSQIEDLFLDDIVSSAEILSAEQRKKLHVAANRKLLGLPPG